MGVPQRKGEGSRAGGQASGTAGTLCAQGWETRLHPCAPRTAPDSEPSALPAAPRLRGLRGGSDAPGSGFGHRVASAAAPGSPSRSEKRARQGPAPPLCPTRRRPSQTPLPPPPPGRPPVAPALPGVLGPHSPRGRALLRDSGVHAASDPEPSRRRPSGADCPGPPCRALSPVRAHPCALHRPPRARAAGNRDPQARTARARGA